MESPNGERSLDPEGVASVITEPDAVPVSLYVRRDFLPPLNPMLYETGMSGWGGWGNPFAPPKSRTFQIGFGWSTFGQEHFIPILTIDKMVKSYALNRSIYLEYDIWQGTGNDFEVEIRLSSCTVADSDSDSESEERLIVSDTESLAP